MVIRFIVWLGKMLIGAALVSTIAVYVAWASVQVYVDKLVKDLQIGSLVQKPQFSDLLSKLSDNSNILKSSGPTSVARLDPSPTPSPVGKRALGEAVPSPALSSSPSPDDLPSGAGAAGSSSNTPDAPKDALPVWSQSSSAAAQNGIDAGKKRLVLSAEQFFEKKEKMSNDDKLKVFTILADRIPENALQQMSAYVEDGITEDEMAKIEEIFEKYVKPEELKQLEAILEKY